MKSRSNPDRSGIEQPGFSITTEKSFEVSTRQRSRNGMRCRPRSSIADCRPPARSCRPSNAISLLYLLPFSDHMGRRARARKAPVRVLPVRMVVRDAQRRGAAAARPGAGRARRRHRSEGRLGLQPAVERRLAGIRRRRLVLQARRRRALGRLSAVLPDVPLPSTRSGLPRCALPTVDARQHRRDGRRGVPESSQRARLRACRCPRARLPAGEGAEGVQRDDARRAEGS